MVDRLNVVLVSRSGLGGESEAMIEAIVGNLAGRAGIDLVLVDPLAEINDDSTDQLPLLSIGSGAAVLTWTSPEQTMSDLGRVGFTGVRSPHAGDPSSPPRVPNPLAPVTGRKVYTFDLRDLTTVDDLIAQLDRLRTVQAVKTFSLGGSAPLSKPYKTPLPPAAVTEPASTLPPTPNPPADNLASRNRRPTSLGDAGLDDLIDQLDDFDA